MRWVAVGVGVAVAAAAAFVDFTAAAAECTTLNLPSPVYFAAGTVAKPLLKVIAARVSALPQPITIFFQSVQSCEILDSAANGIKVSKTVTYWEAPGGAEKTCDPPVGGYPIDIGIPDVWPDTCGVTLPPTLKDFHGPVQTMGFVVPAASSESSISAEAAYAVFGYGAAQYTVAPWTDPAFIFQRPNTSGTKLMIGRAIGLPGAKWKGSVQTGSGDLLAQVASSTNPNATLGILAADYFDVSRDKVKVLAYQHKGAKCGYYPDSTSTSFDKINVREGRYPIWGPQHLIAQVDSGGRPTKPEVATILRYFSREGFNDSEKKDMIDTEVAGHFVPTCAMKVTRSSEMGPLTPFDHPEPCGCYFELKANAQARSTCTTCAADAACSGATPKCRYGYCEAR